jgi:hypothetical protein
MFAIHALYSDGKRLEKVFDTNIIDKSCIRNTEYQTKSSRYLATSFISTGSTSYLPTTSFAS